MYTTLRAFTQHSTHGTESRHNFRQSREMSGKFSKLFKIKTFKEDDYPNLVSINLTKYMYEIATQRGKGSYKFKTLLTVYHSKEGKVAGIKMACRRIAMSKAERNKCVYASSIWFTFSTPSNPETNLAQWARSFYVNEHNHNGSYPPQRFPQPAPPRRLLHSDSLTGASESVLS